jgi:hypothetical protein
MKRRHAENKRTLGRIILAHARYYLLRRTRFTRDGAPDRADKEAIEILEALHTLVTLGAPLRKDMSF